VISTRRQFLQAGALGLAGLALEISIDGRLRRAGEAFAAAAEPNFHPFAWLSIEPSGRTVLTIGRVEMGQGVRTSLAMILAEELDADWARVEVINAEPGPDFPHMRTSGSWSVGGACAPLRLMGARARAMLIGAAAKRWSVDPATCTTAAGRVRHAASGREAGYGALAAAAAAIAVPASAPLKDAASFTTIGRATRRVDARAIVTGAARFGIDARLPGMRFAALDRCPVRGGTPRSVDDAMARAVPGVLDVVRAGDAIAVVANSTWAAFEGRRALSVAWDEGAGRSFDSRAYRAELAERSKSGGVAGPARGDVDAAWAGAARRLDALYEYPFYIHAPLEPMNALADVRSDRCELWTGTQAPNQMQEAVAKLLGMAPAAVTIHVPLLGGGFGRRLGLDYGLEAAQVSKAMRAPVQVVWSREDDMRHGFFQPAAAHRMSAALDATGRIAAWSHREASSPLNFSGPADLHDPDIAANHMWGGVDNPYVYPAMRAAFVAHEAPILLGPWRAVFAPSNVMARECFMDEIAHATGQDPVAMRLAYLEAADDADQDQRTRRARLAKVIRLAGEKAGWSRALPPGEGLGIAAHLYDGETTLAQIAHVRVKDGAVQVLRLVCAIDCGLVVNPLGLSAQIESGVIWGLSQTLCAEATFRAGRLEQSGFADYPMLRLAQAPAIETHFVPGGAQPLGAGEQPVAPVAAAVLNATFAATGRRVRHVPITAADLS
jgi:isoquinoline 1-oxidoreductase beta subunit